MVRVAAYIELVGLSLLFMFILGTGNVRPSRFSMFMCYLGMVLVVIGLPLAIAGWIAE